jgi:ribosomal protein S18 acetylase RimI-like enzyme
VVTLTFFNSLLDRPKKRVYFLTMSFTQRSFQNQTDLDLMLALARAHRSETLHDIDLPYRLCSWGLDDKQNTQLWFNAQGELAGWAVMQTPFWTIDLLVAPDVESELYPQVLAWADARAKQIVDTPTGRPSWFVPTFQRHTQQIAPLEALGFASQTQADYSWAKALLRHTDPLPGPILPEGFTIRPLAGQAEVPGYVELHRIAFDTKNMTEPWRARTLQHSAYRPDLDLVVIAPDGRLAAFCIAWLDHDSSGKSLGRIEPLGTHPDFRKLGLGRAALHEAMRRLRALGADAIDVESDITEGSAFSFYQAQGFKVIEKVEVMGRDYA